MPGNISISLKRKVAERAHYCCEYCLAFEGHAFIRFQIDHIISKKHGGTSNPENLAYSCFFCNNFKGTDLGTFIKEDRLVRFFNPRKNVWIDHFEFDGPILHARTEIGAATVKILRINDPERLSERQALIEANQFPHINALRLIRN